MIPTQRELIDMFGDKGGNQSPPPLIRYGKIDPSYTSGKPKVIFDTDIDVSGSGTPSVKAYPYLASYTPRPNDRVMLLGKVIIGKIMLS